MTPDRSERSPREVGLELDELARLAMLKLGAAEADELGVRLQRVLDAVAVLHAADLDGVPPTQRCSAPPAAAREDSPAPWIGPDPWPGGAPRGTDGAAAIPAPRPGEDST